MSDMEILKSIDPHILVELYRETMSLQHVFVALNMSGKSKYVRDAVRQIIGKQDPTLVVVVSARCIYSIEDIKNAVVDSMCMSDVLRKLNLSSRGSNADTIKKQIIKHNIDFSHFDISLARSRNKHRWTDEDIFVEHSPIPRSSLSAYVRRRSILGLPKCVECGITDTYNNKPIKLTVDHINGISDDNRKENLRWLCHNCHSQTSTFGRKNRRTAGVA